ncbi:UDP-3-O-(3-hydroxymyristoyl)glucosamine N-acyltransferase, partial [Rhodanobacter denitrificans]|nr:UDP-3-O-(3-hydroxymyristoyl)glucosamine N-acyltransferase [Rhodanobacter denitrificans]
MSAINYTVAELAERFGLSFSGDGARVIDGVGTLAGA